MRLLAPPVSIPLQHVPAVKVPNIFISINALEYVLMVFMRTMHYRYAPNAYQLATLVIMDQPVIPVPINSISIQLEIVLLTVPMEILKTLQPRFVFLAHHLAQHVNYLP